MHTIPLTRTIAPIRTSSIRERITRLEEFEGVDALIPQVAARQLQGCPAGHQLHVELSGAEPGQGAIGQARLPVPGARHEPAEAAVPRGLRTLSCSRT